LLAEGHLLLAEKIGRIDHRLEKAETQLNFVIAELLAHRADTEAHKIYQVKEG
jgi:tetrahydromethanopterin S-methyltransferase subunit G